MRHKTRDLSAEGTVLPNLVGRLKDMDAEIFDRFEEAGLPSPNIELPDRLQAIFQRVTTISILLPFTGEKEKHNRKRAIDETTLLMHEMCATSEYLRNLLHAALPPCKRKAISAAKSQLDAEVELLFRAPINAIKHSHFKLTWLEARSPAGDTCIVKGLVLNGMIDRLTTGPATHKFGRRVFADGYSFPLLLRKAIDTIYAQFDIVDCALTSALSQTSFGRTTSSNTAPKLADAAKEALLYLTTLPRTGFPGEAKYRMNELVLEGGSVRVARTFKLARLKSESRFKFEITARPGHTFVLPYWVRDD